MRLSLFLTTKWPSMGLANFIVLGWFPRRTSAREELTLVVQIFGEMRGGIRMLGVGARLLAAASVAPADPYLLFRIRFAIDRV